MQYSRLESFLIFLHTRKIPHFLILSPVLTKLISFLINFGHKIVKFPLNSFLLDTYLVILLPPPPGSAVDGNDLGLPVSGCENNGKPGNQVATKSLHSSEIFGKIPL